MKSFILLCGEGKYWNHTRKNLKLVTGLLKVDYIWGITTFRKFFKQFHWTYQIRFNYYYAKIMPLAGYFLTNAAFSFPNNLLFSRTCCTKPPYNTTTEKTYIAKALTPYNVTTSISVGIRDFCPGILWPKRLTVKDCYYYDLSYK